MTQPSNSATYDVVGLGNAIVDVLSHENEAFLTKNELIKGSMQLIDEQQAKALYSLMGPGRETSGGSAANTLAGFASLGGKGAFIGKVKDDTLGEVFAHDIRAIGVTYTTPAASEGPATARCLVVVTPDAQRTMSTFLGANVLFCENDVDEETVAASHVVYLEGYLYDSDPAMAAFIKAATIAHRENREVSLSLSDTFCVDRHRDAFKDLVENHIDILFANEAEITALYQVNSLGEAMQALRGKCKIAVLTCSSNGAVVLNENEVTRIPAKRIEQVVDTTGAGDLFASGFLYGYTHGYSLEDAGQIGAIAAAEVISHDGARPKAKLKNLIPK